MLKRCIKKLATQSLNKNNYEVIIIDDGGNDNCQEVFKEFKNKINIKYYWQENKGPASARNLGIEKSKGCIILFLNDDVAPIKKNFLDEHLKLNKDSNFAYLGFGETPKTYLKNEFIRFLAPEGDFFNLRHMKDGEECLPFQFMTYNLSINKKWLKNDRFDENFTDAVLEDTELGIRLYKKGLKLLYKESIPVWHYHKYNNINEFIEKRQKRFRKNYIYLGNKYKIIKYKRLIKGPLLKILWLFSFLIYKLIPVKKTRSFYWKRRIIGSSYS